MKGNNSCPQGQEAFLLSCKRWFPRGGAQGVLHQPWSPVPPRSYLKTRGSRAQPQTPKKPGVPGGLPSHENDFSAPPTAQERPPLGVPGLVLRSPTRRRQRISCSTLWRRHPCSSTLLMSLLVFPLGRKRCKWLPRHPPHLFLQTRPNRQSKHPRNPNLG